MDCCTAAAVLYCVHYRKDVQTHFYRVKLISACVKSYKKKKEVFAIMTIKENAFTLFPKTKCGLIFLPSADSKQKQQVVG